MAVSKISARADADYVIEKGVSGEWNYRKWNSGFCEAWKEYSGSITAQTATGNLYTSSGNQTENLPSGLFNSVLMALGDLKSYSTWIVMANWTTEAIYWRPISTTSRTQTSFTLSFYVIGTWK